MAIDNLETNGGPRNPPMVIEWGTKGGVHNSDWLVRLIPTIAYTVIGIWILKEALKLAGTRLIFLGLIAVFFLYWGMRNVFQSRSYTENVSFNENCVQASCVRSQFFGARMSRTSVEVPWSQVKQIVFNWKTFMDGVVPSVVVELENVPAEVRWVHHVFENEEAARKAIAELEKMRSGKIEP